MTTTTLHNSPRMLTQKTSGEMELAEACIGISHDANPILVLTQEGRDVLINLESVNELCRELKRVKAAAKQWEKEQRDE